MPTVVIEASAAGREKRAEIPDGGELVDVCDEILAAVPFSCRSAMCGTCQIQVLEGAELLEPASDDEQELLSLIAGEGTRLACQARVKAGEGLVRLRAVGVGA